MYKYLTLIVLFNWAWRNVRTQFTSLTLARAHFVICIARLYRRSSATGRGMRNEERRGIRARISISHSQPSSAERRALAQIVQKSGCCPRKPTLKKHCVIAE